MLENKILAIDTAYQSCSAAVVDNGEIRCLELHDPIIRSQRILGMIAEILKAEDWQHLSALAFSAGPGSLTGLKISSSIIQAFKLVYNKPIIKVSTLAALALQAHEQFGSELVMPCIDAKMGQVYYGLYQFNNGDMISVGSDVVAEYCEVVLLDSSLLLVGDGARLLANFWGQNIKENVTLDFNLTSSSAEYVAKIAARIYMNYNNIQEDAIPWYLNLYE